MWKWPGYMMMDFWRAATGVSGKPQGYGIDHKIITETPFSNLRHFQNADKPKLLIIAPMSGHFGSQLRSTVAGLLPDHDIYMLDWKNPRDVPLSNGIFGFETYMDCVISAIEQLGADTHVMGISQSTVPLLAAAAVLADRNGKAAPQSITLIGGPIDTRGSKTTLHDFVRAMPLDRFKANVVESVPANYKGHGRRVYPGMTQLAALLTHMPFAPKTADTFAVMDLDEAFFLETLDHVYKSHSLAMGKLTYQGKKVDLSALNKTALLTIEGAKDAMVPPGETHAAHDLCPNIPAVKRLKFTDPASGHYEIAMGKNFKTIIAPKITDFIKNNPHSGKKPKPATCPRKN